MMASRSLLASFIALLLLCAFVHGGQVTTHDMKGIGPEKVVNFAGYVTVNTTRNLFYWFFESRNSPSTDPFILWMTGGPGCSGMIALFAENGPYKIEKGTEKLILNPYSWNSNASILFIDQPVGAGFSYDTSYIDPGVLSEKDMAENMFEFFQKWFKQYPKYASLRFFIAAESYGGHYAPALAHYIQINNRRAQIPINLRGVMIGDGLVDPVNQYPQYPNYAIDKKLVSTPVADIMQLGVIPCVELIRHCIVSSPFGLLDCITAFIECNYAEIVPVELTGVNLYDVREPCKVLPLCYDFSDIENLLADPSFKAQLGVPSDVSWHECNRVVDLELVFAGDWMQSFAFAIPTLLAAGIPVLVYHGNEDYICNWYGGNAWTRSLEWPGKDGFNAAPNISFVVNGSKAGEYHTYQKFTFLLVYEAGHMVPMDQPAAALAMVNSFTTGRWG